MSTWIPFAQYPGFEILDDASKIKTPEGEFDLKADKLFYFINPATGTKNFAKPDVLLARALKGGAPKAPRDPNAPVKTKTSKKAPSEKKLAREKAKAEKQAKKDARIAAKAAKLARREAKKQQLEEKKINVAKKRVQLLPDTVADQFRMYMHSQVRKEGGSREERGLSGIFIDYENRRNRVVTILFNTEKNLILLRIEGPQNWRGDRFFYNPDTEKYLRFDEPVHKPGYGNAAVIWPDGLDGEHLLGAKHNEIRLRRELARAQARSIKAAGLEKQEADAAKKAEEAANAPEGEEPKKQMNSYQKKKARELATRLGIKDLSTVHAAREAVGM